MSKKITKIIKTKETKTSNTVLAVLGVFCCLFIITMIVTFWVKGSVPDTLITCVLGSSAFEVVSCAAIKISKVVKGEITKSEDMEELE